MPYTTCPDLAAVLSVAGPTAREIAAACGSVRIGNKLIRIPLDRLERYLLDSGSHPDAVADAMAELTKRAGAAS